jgi:hypothetical protein
MTYLRWPWRIFNLGKMTLMRARGGPVPVSVSLTQQRLHLAGRRRIGLAPQNAYSAGGGAKD